MKSSLKTLMIFTAITSAYSAEAKLPSSFAGAYIGTQIGISSQAYKVRCGYLGQAGNVANLPNEATADAHNKSARKNVFIASLMAGYGWVHNNVIYTGVEMVISKEGNKKFTTKDSNSQGGVQTVNQSKIAYKRGVDWGLSSRFGYIIDQWMPFLKLGLAISRDNVKQNLDTNMQGVGVLLTTNQYKRVKTIPSFIIGAGVDYRLTNHWNARLAYDYRIQGKVTLPKITENAAVGGAGPFIGTKLKNIRNHTVQIGAIYKF